MPNQQHQVRVPDTGYQVREITNAIRSKNYPKLEACVTSGISPDIQVNDRGSALVMAIDLDDAEAAKILLKRSQQYMQAPLQAAIEQQRKRIVGLIVTESIERRQGTTMLFTMIQANSPKAVKYILDRGISASSTDPFGKPALDAAIQYGSLDTINTLLDHGAKINARKPTSFRDFHPTPLLLAADEQKPDVVVLLLNRGANAAATDKEKNGAFHYLKDSATGTAVYALLQCGADPNLRNSKGITPLMAVSGSTDPDVVQLLLNAGAHPNPRGQGLLGYQPSFKDYHVTTPLIEAANAGNLTAVRALIRAGAEIDAEDKFGTALYHAARTGHAGIAQELLMANADPLIPYRKWTSHREKEGFSESSEDLAILDIARGDTTEIIMEVMEERVRAGYSAQRRNDKREFRVLEVLPEPILHAWKRFRQRAR